jgi:hypothetical protein
LASSCTIRNFQGWQGQICFHVSYFNAGMCPMLTSKSACEGSLEA